MDQTISLSTLNPEHKEAAITLVTKPLVIQKGLNKVRSSANWQRIYLTKPKPKFYIPLLRQ